MTIGTILVIALAAVLPPIARGAEDLPARAVARVGDHRFYHGPGLTRAALSPMAAAPPRLLLSPCTTASPRRLSAILTTGPSSSGTPPPESASGRSGAPNGPIDGVAFSPDGARLAAVSRDGVALFNTTTGHLLCKFGSDKLGGCPRFSTDGTELWIGERHGRVDCLGRCDRQADPSLGSTRWPD